MRVLWCCSASVDQSAIRGFTMLSKRVAGKRKEFKLRPANFTLQSKEPKSGQVTMPAGHFSWTKFIFWGTQNIIGQHQNKFLPHWQHILPISVWYARLWLHCQSAILESIKENCSVNMEGLSSWICLPTYLLTCRVQFNLMAHALHAVMEGVTRLIFPQACWSSVGLSWCVQGASRR